MTGRGSMGLVLGALLLACVCPAYADFEIYFLRHGETTWNRDRILQGSISNIALTAKGERMAALTADGLAREGIAFDVAYTSPYLRSRRTAEIVAGRLGVALRTDDRLREMCFGAYEGCRYGGNDWPDDNLRNFFENPEAYVPRGKGAESFPQVQARLRDFMETELKPLDGKVTRVLCVVHSLVLKSIVRELAGNGAPASARKPIQKNCCVHVVRYAGGTFALRETGRMFYDVADLEKPDSLSMTSQSEREKQK